MAPKRPTEEMAPLASRGSDLVVATAAAPTGELEARPGPEALEVPPEVHLPELAALGPSWGLGAQSTVRLLAKTSLLGAAAPEAAVEGEVAAAKAAMARARPVHLVAPEVVVARVVLLSGSTPSAASFSRVPVASTGRTGALVGAAALEGTDPYD
ncbi:MAG: hypothetical protein GWN58_23545 [Anaerolineae bacterium]|nr:hypothetical protein [Anaerolineae bacterium]